MNRRQRTNLSFFLMVAGLALLLSFQLLWLYTTYQEEKSRLIAQIDDLFSLSLRQINDSLTQAYYQGAIVIRLDEPIDNMGSESLVTMATDIKKILADSNLSHAGISIRRIGKNSQLPSNLSLPIPPNSIKKISVRNHTLKLALDTDSLPQPLTFTDKKLQFKIRSITDLPEFTPKHRSALFLPQSDSLQDSDSLKKSHQQVVASLLSQYLSKNSKDLGFTPAYKLVFRTDSSAHTSKGEFFSHFFEESTKSGPYRYAIFTPNKPLYLLRQILPQMLFSLLLFASIGAAFALIYFNLRQQERLTLLKNDFIGNVTHELKTPITTVSVAIEALRTFNALEDPKRTQEYLSISQQELRRLSILVDRVLKMSLFERQRPELKIEMIDLKRLAQNILDSMKLQFERCAAQVSFEAEGNYYELEGDRAHLTSVIYNLVDNALKYSPDQPQIELRLISFSGYLQLSIADKGIGIAVEHQGKIFDKFFRVPQGNQHNIKGYGLGLSYVAGVIGQHKGQIKVHSQLGQGTRFTLILPREHV